MSESAPFERRLRQRDSLLDEGRRGPSRPPPARPLPPPTPDDVRDGPGALARRIEQYFRGPILDGHVPAGSRLPTVRAVAARLDTTPETVAAAYRLLAEAGLVRTRPGAGTTVLRPGGRSADTPKTSLVRVAPALGTPSFSEIYRRLLQFGAGGVGGFASYTPAPELLPAGLERLARSICRREGRRLFELAPAEGDLALRRAIAAARPRPVDPQHIVITGGAQEALSLVFRALVAPGDLVAVESPTYLGALEALAAMGARVAGVPVDADGPDLGALEALARERRPRLFYTMPSYQNPSGATMPLGRRRRLLALARRLDLTIVEDAAAAALRLDGPQVPALADLDGDGRVIHVGSLSKTLAGGLRIGCVIARAGFVEPLLRLKYVTNIHTPLFQQRLAHALLAPRRLARHLDAACREYRRRRDAMLAALERHAGGRVGFAPPAGGLAVWVTLPGGLDAADLYRLAVDRGVGFVPGAVFYADGHRHDTLRLCFSAVAPDAIEAGVARLSAALDELMRRAPRPSPGLLPL